MKLETILDRFPFDEFLVADGFNEAIIGYSGDKLVYSVSECIRILMEEGLTDEEAWEHFEYNVAGGYVGEKTPIWCYDE